MSIILYPAHTPIKILLRWVLLGTDAQKRGLIGQKYDKFFMRFLSFHLFFNVLLGYLGGLNYSEMAK